MPKPCAHWPARTAGRVHRPGRRHSAACADRSPAGPSGMLRPRVGARKRLVQPWLEGFDILAPGGRGLGHLALEVAIGFAFVSLGAEPVPEHESGAPGLSVDLAYVQPHQPPRIGAAVEVIR